MGRLRRVLGGRWKPIRRRGGVIEAEKRTREDIAKEALEGETRRREEAETRLGVATEALKLEAEEAKQRYTEEALRRLEEG